MGSRSSRLGSDTVLFRQHERAHLEHQLLEGLRDGDVRLGAGLHKQAAVASRKVLPLLRRHLPVCVLRTARFRQRKLVCTGGSLHPWLLLELAY